MNSARHHTDQAHAEGDTTRIISEPTPTESMVGMEGGTYRAVLTDNGPVELPDDAVTRRLFGDPNYQSPEVIREKLRACSAHYCRAVGCVNKVWVCGNYCERCAEEIAALEKHYAEANRPRNIFARIWRWVIG